MDRILTYLPAGFTALDLAAVALVLAAIPATNWAIEAAPWAGRSMSSAMQGFRLLWMAQMLRRENRIMDTQLLGIIRQGSAFYASASMIGIGALAALIGQAETVEMLARGILPGDEGRHVWEIKLLFPLGVMVYAFLKFAWAHRLFGYCAVLMGAVPPLESGAPDTDAALGADLARRAGLLNISASRNFNRGLRAVYFALATLAWAFGPAALALALALTLLMLMRREFASRARAAIGSPPPQL